MTVEEHIRTAEHHLTEALAAMKSPRSRAVATGLSITRERIITMLLNIVGLVDELRKRGLR